MWDVKTTELTAAPMTVVKQLPRTNSDGSQINGLISHQMKRASEGTRSERTSSSSRNSSGDLDFAFEDGRPQKIHSGTYQLAKASFFSSTHLGTNTKKSMHEDIDAGFPCHVAMLNGDMKHLAFPSPSCKLGA